LFRDSLFSESSRRRFWIGSSKSYDAIRRRADTHELIAFWNRGSLVEIVATLVPPDNSSLRKRRLDWPHLTPARLTLQPGLGGQFV
jgi:hypothetical protein